MIGTVEVTRFTIDGRLLSGKPEPKVAEIPMRVDVELLNGNRLFDARSGGNVGVPCEATLTLVMGPIAKRTYSIGILPALATWEIPANLKANERKRVTFSEKLPEGWEPEVICSLELTVAWKVYTAENESERKSAKYLYQDCIDLLSPNIVGMREEQNARDAERLDKTIIT